MIDLHEILDKMNPNQKINYDKILQKMVVTWQKDKVRPSILLHSCCAPCSTYTLEYLTQYADVTVYYANSNIHPRAEYQRREYVQRKFISDFNQKTGNDVQFIAAPYEPQEYFLAVRGLEKEPEGGQRCRACFSYRLDLVAAKAVELGFDYFGSALTISPHKNSQVVNSVGIEVQNFYSTMYLPSDFKKNNGYRRSVEMCQEYDVYRQCYCGCIFAAKAQGIDLAKTRREALAYLKDKDVAEDFMNIKFVYHEEENKPLR
ncbi:MAG: epoxyqueuosine reductase QueH [Liquorilactobacillus hordei]|uniref:Epoxyqueuosine reductase QueH n=1 Tax=Liquorilactobacillus hordei TaxID=468911 RepID=A0A3Q8C897_9LACO|nr:epoxyqueuosine reductase QueH [Liquorilactobacillus hordei]AUJ28787.1 DNA integration/recombination/inversion protein [Liquorilactobacillus hordei]MBZ2406188.1 DNA integration/recombination/inversion protein [Liquorilactobacillus hordei]